MRFIFALLTFSHIAFSYEVDNYSRRHEIANIKDSLEILDQEVERRLSLVLKEMNGVECAVEKPEMNFKEYQIKDEAINKLINAVHKQFDGNDKGGEIEKLAEDFKKEPSSGIFGYGVVPDRRKYIQIIPFEESIYKNSNTFLSTVEIGSNIKVNGIYMGTDKLGHFFSEGFDIYKYKKQGLGNALKASLNTTEKSVYGRKTTGVTSYADMMANYQGYLFWENVWRSKNSYFECQNNKWVRSSRKFTFADYVNHGFDEAYNCSDFHGTLKEKIRLPQSCPVDVNKCIELKNKFKYSYNEYFIHPSCLNATADNNQKEQAGQKTKSPQLPSNKKTGLQ